MTDEQKMLEAVQRLGDAIAALLLASEDQWHGDPEKFREHVNATLRIAWRAILCDRQKEQDVVAQAERVCAVRELDDHDGSIQ